MGAHALLSASGSHRWLHCTPSARLEEKFEDESSIYAAEGTAAHALAEYKLKKYLRREAQRPTSPFDSEEMDSYTDDYVAYAIELIAEAGQRCKDPIILVEQRLDFSCYVSDGFGTGDLVIVADGELDIVDLKYGRGVMVSAEDNPQMKLYALGALSLFDCLYDIKTIRMCICQPRLENVSEYVVGVGELTKWAEAELKIKAEMAFKGEGEFIPGAHCRFCRAKYTCRARADGLAELAKYDFEKPALLADEEISEILEKAEELEAWCRDVWAWAEAQAVNGKEWTGFKVVEGRSNRRYTDEKKAAEVLTSAGFGEIYKRSLLGISEMEKMLGRKRFSEILTGLIEKPPGKPTLVPISDKRPAISTVNIDFKEEA